MKIIAPCPLQPRSADTVAGGFQCHKCQRVVYDMREYNEINEAEWKKGDKCGIFRTDQIQPIHLSFSKKIYFAILVLLASWGLNLGPMNAQDIPHQNKALKGRRNELIEKEKKAETSLSERKIQWWQFRKKRKRKQDHWIGCPSF